MKPFNLKNRKEQLYALFFLSSFSILLLLSSCSYRSLSFNRMETIQRNEVQKKRDEKGYSLIANKPDQIIIADRGSVLKAESSNSVPASGNMTTAVQINSVSLKATENSNTFGKSVINIAHIKPLSNKSTCSRSEAAVTRWIYLKMALFCFVVGGLLYFFPFVGPIFTLFCFLIGGLWIILWLFSFI